MTYISKKTIIERTHSLYGNVTPETVGAYKRELLKTVEELRDHLFAFDTMLDMSRDHMDSLKSALNHEIDLCDFYLEYSKRLKSGELDRWTFTKTGDRDCDSWTNKGDCWEYMTGKVKAIIEISNNKASTKITMKLNNDSKFLDFLGSWRTSDMRYTNVRSDEGIQKAIDKYKIEALGLLGGLQFPKSSQEHREHTALKKLLHIDIEADEND